MTNASTPKTSYGTAKALAEKHGFFIGDSLAFSASGLIALIAEVSALAAQPPAVAAIPEGMKITEEMHIAAVKVLHRASGVDGLPQRMLDAMLAVAPQPPAGQQDRGEAVTDEQVEAEIRARGLLRTDENRAVVRARLLAEVTTAPSAAKPITARQCNYAMPYGRICNKCGRLHESSGK